MTLVSRITWKTWLVLLAVSQGILIAMSLWTFPFISSHADGLTAFDMKPFGYSISEARAFLGAIDEAGRSFYRNVQLPLDALYPALLCLFVVATLVLAFRIAGIDLTYDGKRPRPIALLALVPILGTLGDYCENICVCLMLSKPPAAPDALIRAANACTLVKSLCTTIGWSSIVIIAVVSLASRFGSERKSWKIGSR